MAVEHYKFALIEMTAQDFETIDFLCRRAHNVNYLIGDDDVFISFNRNDNDGFGYMESLFATVTMRIPPWLKKCFKVAECKGMSSNIRAASEHMKKSFEILLEVNKNLKEKQNV